MPNLAKVDQLISFLPRISGSGFSPVNKWKGAESSEHKSIALPWPADEEVVIELFKVASDAVISWRKTDYLESEAVERVEDAEFISNASLEDVQVMLTWCVRGERFCTGHWQASIESGLMRRLLARLVEIRQDCKGD